MRKTRFLSTGKPTPAHTPPVDPHAWSHLLKLTIIRAEMVGDRRAPGLRKAMTDGRAEAVLRQMGILGPVDIDRELPKP